MDGARIFVVDDEPLIALSIEGLLTRRGYRVRSFTDPLVAITAFESAPEELDLLFTDLTMPATSGFEVTRVVRAKRADVHVVLYSAYVSEEWEREAAALGIARILSKPSPAAEIVKAVAEVLGP